MPDNKSPEINGLLCVAAGIVVDDCPLTTNMNNLQIAFEDHFMAKNIIQIYQTFENMYQYNLLKLVQSISDPLKLLVTRAVREFSYMIQ